MKLHTDRQQIVTMGEIAAQRGGDIPDNVVAVPVCHRDCVRWAFVDADRSDEFSASRWHFGTDGYARRCSSLAERAAGAPQHIAMHRQVLGVHTRKWSQGDPDVDHINGGRMDNWMANLRQVSRSHNNLNRHARTGGSRFVGVSWFRPAKLWRAYLNKNGARVELGYFREEDDAARARDAAAILHFGDVANLNFPATVSQ